MYGLCVNISTEVTTCSALFSFCLVGSGYETPDSSRNAFLSLEAVCREILGECHQASGKHPHTKITKVKIISFWNLEYILVHYNKLFVLAFMLAII